MTVTLGQHTEDYKFKSQLMLISYQLKIED